VGERLTDKDRPTIILGVAGSLQGGRQRKILRDLIKHKLVRRRRHGGLASRTKTCTPRRGYDFWRASSEMDDLELRSHMLDRLYDTLVTRRSSARRTTTSGISSRASTQQDVLHARSHEVLRRALPRPQGLVGRRGPRSNVPIFVPTIHDSSIGIGMVQNYVKAKGAGKPYRSST